MSDESTGVGCIFAAMVLGLASVAGWLTHLYICFTEDRWGFLIAGAIFAPVGVIHGWGRWLGVW